MATATAPKQQESPYLLAKREHDERYGTFIKSAKNWRIVACLSLVGLFGSLAVNGVQASRAQVVPYVVLMDNLGRPVASGIAGERSIDDEKVIMATMDDWVSRWRSVTADGTREKKDVDWVYAHLGRSSPASTAVTNWYRDNQPFARAKNEVVAVDIRSTLMTTKNTMEIEWVETASDLSGGTKSTDHYKGSFTIVQSAAKDAKDIQANPLGIWVTSVSWSKVAQ